MAWQTITTGSLLTTLSQAEYDQFTTLSTGSLFTGPQLVQNIITDVTQEIRGIIAGNPRNQLDQDETTVPTRLFTTAKAIIVYKLMERIVGSLADKNDSRINDYNDARKTLTLVKNGEFGIDLPANPVINTQYNTFYGSSDLPRIY